MNHPPRPAGGARLQRGWPGNSNRRTEGDPRTRPLRAGERGALDRSIRTKPLQARGFSGPTLRPTPQTAARRDSPSASAGGCAQSNRLTAAAEVASAPTPRGSRGRAPSSRSLPSLKPTPPPTPPLTPSSPPIAAGGGRPFSFLQPAQPISNRLLSSPHPVRHQMDSPGPEWEC